MSSKKEKKIEVLVVHFTSSIMLGRSLDVRTYISQGDIVLGDLVNIDIYDDNFLRINYSNKGEGYQAYSELIPLAQVSKILFKD